MEVLADEVTLLNGPVAIRSFRPRTTVHQVRFTTKSILAATTVIGIVVSGFSGLMAQSFSLLAQNLLVFYINAALILTMAIGISSALGQNRLAVIVASACGFVAASFLVWGVTLFETRFRSFAGLQILAQIPIVFAISRSNLLIREEKLSLDDQPHSSQRLKEFAEENFAKHDSTT